MTIQKCDHCGTECRTGSATQFNSTHHLVLRGDRTDITVDFVLSVCPAGMNVGNCISDPRVRRDLCAGCQLLIARELVEFLEKKAQPK